MPKKTKYRKEHKRYHNGRASTMLNVSFGDFGIKALEGSWVTSRQIEATRRVIAKYTKKGGKVWIRIFPDKPVTQKGGEMPMGKGKGSVDHYVAVVKQGTVMFEIAGMDEDLSKKVLKLAAYKLPVKCKFVSK